MKMIMNKSFSSSCCFVNVVGLILLVLLFVQVISMSSEFDRFDFPSDFIFGASSSAYQAIVCGGEGRGIGAASEDGRTPSTFDTSAHSGDLPGNGDVTADQYHKYKEDVDLMAETGLDAYRFSISWSRLIPNGRGAVNPKGLEYYNNLVDTLISKGIEPHVTLLHADIPQVLDDEYGGVVSPKFIDDFVAYADVCFREFGDRVLHWTTINEANLFAAGEEESRPFSRPFLSIGDTRSDENSIYLTGHNILLAHASATRLYRVKYQAEQNGLVGINLYAYNFIPYTNTEDDIIATRRAYDFFTGWFMQPLTHGEYPSIMKKNAGTRLPTFTQNETELLKGSFDFIGLNYYNVNTVKDNSITLTKEPRDYFADQAIILAYINDSDPFQGQSFLNTPWGLQGALEHFKQVYDNPLVLIHENGQFANHCSDYDTLLNDQPRVEYIQGHIGAVLDAIRNGSNVKGYFVWSFLDMYEMMFGTQYTFGLYYVDFNDPKLTRRPRLSQKWYSRFLKGEKPSMEVGIHTTDEAEIHTS